MDVKIKCDTCHNQLDNKTLEQLFEVYTMYRKGVIEDSAFLGHLYKIFTNAPFKEVTDCFDEEEASECAKQSYLIS